MEEKPRPKVGVGVYILNQDKQLLLMLRKGGVGDGQWCPPGGHLENFEELLDCVKRETLEEINLNVAEAEMWAVNNNFMHNPDRHYVNLDFLVTKWSGEPKNMELEKCYELKWVDLSNLPENLFAPSMYFFSRNPMCIVKAEKNLMIVTEKNETKIHH